MRGCRIYSHCDRYIAKAIDASYTYEQIRTSVTSQRLRPLVKSLTEDCHHSAVVAAILSGHPQFASKKKNMLTPRARAARWLFTSGQVDDTGIQNSRGFACELVAWEFLQSLAERELMDHLLLELPTGNKRENQVDDAESRGRNETFRQSFGDPFSENTPLLPSFHSACTAVSGAASRDADSSSETYQADSETLEREAHEAESEANDPTKSLVGLNALEIAVVANAKKFLSQQRVQRVVQDIWDGNIIFWESLSVNAVKKARIYNKRYYLIVTTH